MRDSDDLVARTNTGSSQCQVERIRPVANGDAAPRSAVRGKLFLECPRVRTQEELHRVEYLLDRPHDLALDGLKLGGQVDQRDAHQASSVRSAPLVGRLNSSSTGG